MALIHATTQRWTVHEFRRLLEEGFFSPDERVELIEGEIVRIPKQKPPHSGSVLRSNKRLVLAFHQTHEVGCQLPLELSEYSEPLPDFCIIPNEKAVRGEYLRNADLVIEVADTSLEYDRCEKASLYAKAGVPEYWIVNVRSKCLVVHREPRPDPQGTFGYGWGSVVVLPEDEQVSPLCRPDIMLRVGDLL